MLDFLTRFSMASQIPSFRIPEDECPADFLLVENEASISMTVGLISGKVLECEYDGTSWKTLWNARATKSPIRVLRRIGAYLFLATGTGRIIIMRDGKVVRKPKTIKDDAGEAVEISTFCILTQAEELAETVDDNQEFSVAVGDDYGNVYILKLAKDSLNWECLFTAQEQDDAITDILFHAYRKTLVASSGDGTLLILDTKKLKIIAHTSSLEDEVISLIMDQGNNIIASTGLGALVLYRWGYWGKVAHRMKPSFHGSESVNCMALLGDSSILITGTVDGGLRKLDLKPELTLTGHLEQFNDSVERIRCFNFASSPYAAVSLTNDSEISIIDVNKLPPTRRDVDDIESAGSAGSDDSDLEERPAKKAKQQKKAAAVPKPAQAAVLDNFFSGLD